MEPHPAAPETPWITPPAARHVGVIGSGVMGQSIALVNLRHGVQVTLTDARPAALSAAADWIGRELRRTAVETAAAAPARLRTVADISELADVSVVIEAVVENLAVKRRLLKAISTQHPAPVLLATNTSSLSITALAAAVGQPERFCGLHFCHPVALRPLVEVTAAPQTTSATIDQAVHYIEALRKRTLMTADVPGFAVNRLLFPYLEAAVDLARQGVPFSEIESAAVGFGMPLGPLAQLDDIGIDVILRAAAGMQRGKSGILFPYLEAAVDLARQGVPFSEIESAAVGFGMPLGPLAQLDDIGIDVILRAAAGMQRGKSGIPATSEPLLALYQAGRLGRKSGAGFFQYRTDDAEPRYDPNAPAVIGVTHSTSAGRAADELTLHLFLPMLAAAADLLALSVVKSIGDVRMAFRDGLGFDPARHDLIKWGAGLPVSQLESWLERLSLGSHLVSVRRLLRP